MCDRYMHNHIALQNYVSFVSLDITRLSCINLLCTIIVGVIDSMKMRIIIITILFKPLIMFISSSSKFKVY